MSVQEAHTVVWIDHQQARILRLQAEGSHCTVVHAEGGAQHLHHKANSIDSGHRPEDQRYLHAVSRALAGAGSVLLTGPANEKHELVKHMERHDPALRKRVVEVRTVDHPGDGELVAAAREFFRAFDRMQAQR